jgi:hypothetical protein
MIQGLEVGTKFYFYFLYVFVIVWDFQDNEYGP